MRKIIAGLALLAGLILQTPVEAGASDSASIASYRGRTIDLAVSWEGARACRIADTGNVCYDSEKEMDLAGSVEKAAQPGVLAACGSTLRLYDATSFGTPVLALSNTGVWIQLSAYSFSSKTSSYKVGACSSTFADAGSIYPGNTSAGASATSMVVGWNNRVTQVFIS